MTPLRLNPYDPAHLAVLDTWSDSADKEAQLDAWREQQKQAGREFSDWYAEHREEEKRLGLPKIYEPGRVVWNERGGYHAMKLLDPVRDPITKEALFTRLHQCKTCSTVFGSSDQFERHCSPECKQADQQTKAGEARKKRLVRDKARSSALADRRGICLYCGSEFHLKRASGKTCSDRCRQNLKRKGPQIEIPTIEIPSKESIAALARDVEKHRDADLRVMASAYQRLAVAESDYYFKTGLAQLLIHAPALALWITRQPEDQQPALVKGQGVSQ